MTFRNTQQAIDWLWLHDKPDEYDLDFESNIYRLTYDGDEMVFKGLLNLKDWIIDQRNQVEAVQE
jgi:hypothetical protein